jgi:hypothetical protein
MHVPVYFADQTLLLTMIRSNPGLMVLKDGVVLGMWHHLDFPDPGKFQGNVLSVLLTGYTSDLEWKRVLLLGFVFLFLLLVLLAEKMVRKASSTH